MDLRPELLISARMPDDADLLAAHHGVAYQEMFDIAELQVVEFGVVGDSRIGHVEVRGGMADQDIPVFPPAVVGFPDRRDDTRGRRQNSVSEFPDIDAYVALLAAGSVQIHP